jgi:hypothetical protein
MGSAGRRRTGDREMGLMGKWKRVNGEDEKEKCDAQRNTGGMKSEGIRKEEEGV